MALKLSGAGQVLQSYTGARRGVLAARNALQQARFAQASGDPDGAWRTADLAAQSLNGNRYAMDQLDAVSKPADRPGQAQEQQREAQ